MCIRTSSSDNCQKIDLEKISLKKSGQKRLMTEVFWAPWNFVFGQDLSFSLSIQGDQTLHILTQCYCTLISIEDNHIYFFCLFFSIFSARLFLKKLSNRIITRCVHYDALFKKKYIVAEAYISKLKKTPLFCMYSFKSI